MKYILWRDRTIDPAPAICFEGNKRECTAELKQSIMLSMRGHPTTIRRIDNIIDLHYTDWDWHIRYWILPEGNEPSPELYVDRRDN